MSETETKPLSTSKYFMQQFEAHPEWAEASDNTPILTKYATDNHLGSIADIEANIRNSLAAAKNKFRAKGSKPAKSKRGGRRKKSPQTVMNMNPVTMQNGSNGHADQIIHVPATGIEEMLRKIAREEANNVVTNRLQAAVATH